MAVPKFITNDMKGGYVGGPTTPARRCYVGSSLVFQGFSPASEQEFIQQTAAGGPAQLLKVYGKTIVNNQLVPARSETLTAGGTTAVYTLDGKITITGSTASSVSYSLFISVPLVEGHKYYLAGCPAGGSNSSFSLRYNNNGFGENGDGKILTYSTSQGTSNYMNRVPIIVITNYTITASLVFRPRLIDLTLRFGAGNEPTSADEALRLLGGDAFDPAYDAGSLQSNKTTELRAYDGGTLRGSLQLNLSTLTGKLNGEGASVVVYPDGLRGVGTDRDAAYGSTGEVRRQKITGAGFTLHNTSSAGYKTYKAILNGPTEPAFRASQVNTFGITNYGSFDSSSVAKEIIQYVPAAGRDSYIAIAPNRSIDDFEMEYPLATPLTYTLDTPLPTDLTCEQGDILQRVSDNNCPFVGEMKFGL